MKKAGSRERPRLAAPPNRWRFVAFAMLVLGAAWLFGSVAQRWDQGLQEDRLVYRALGHARAAARLTEAGRGVRSPHLVAYGSAVSTGDPGVLRMVVVDIGHEDEYGVRRDPRTIWALDGTEGDIADLDRPVADKSNYLAVLFEGERKDDAIPLRQLVEISFDEPGMIRVAAFAPVVLDGRPRGLAAALVRTEQPEAPFPATIWVLAGMLVAVFGAGTLLLPAQARVVTASSLLALAVVLSFWVPGRVSGGVRAHLAERAGDWLSIQTMADSREAVALVAPIPEREPWSADGALQIDRERSGEGVLSIAGGGDRAGNETASVRVQPGALDELRAGFDPAVFGWAMAGALLVFLLLGPSARLLHNIRTDPGVYAYVCPAVLGLLVLVFVPFVTGVGLAFYRYHLEGNTYDFIGFGNFAEIVAPDDTSGVVFFRTLGVTLLWTTINVFLHVAIGLALAMVLSRPGLRGRGIYRVLLILPWAIPSYITALLWRAMFVGEDGPVNKLLGVVGVSPVSWFDDNFLTNFVPNVVTNTWLGFPFMMVVCLGALQSIPADLYEAAQLDGASAWQRFRHVTLPLLRPALLPAVILGMIWTFNLFNVIYLVSMGQGNTEILITEAYRQFHEQHRHGFAAAYSVLIFFILLAYGWLAARITKATEGGYET